MARSEHRAFAPRFEGRTRDALVVGMTGNVITVRIKRRKKARPPLSTTNVLVAGRA